jgi:hypothetical protein
MAGRQRDSYRCNRNADAAVSVCRRALDRVRLAAEVVLTQRDPLILL